MLDAYFAGRALFIATLAVATARHTGHAEQEPVHMVTTHSYRFTCFHALREQPIRR